MATLMEALRAADAAGDTEAAQRFAEMIKAQQTGGGQQAPQQAQQDQSLLSQVGDVGLEIAAGVNRGVVELLDIPSQIGNAALQLGGAEFRIPTLAGTELGQAATAGGFVDDPTVRQIAGTLGEFAAPGPPIASLSKRADDATGIAELLPDITKGAPPEDRISSILSAAKKADVPVLTTDLFPPDSFIGRTFQSISEKLGPLGSGSARASQQRARIEAVSSFADEIDIDTQFADSMVKSLNKKSARTLESAGRIRNEAISKLDEFGDFAADRSVGEIDKLLASQERLGATANQALTAELNSFKSELAQASDFSLKKDLRTQLIKKIKAFGRAEDTAPAAELQKVKSALDKDMISFARKNDKPALRKWLDSNRKFASELDRTKNTEIKRILQSGDATPEKVIPILRGGKASELNRLRDALGPKGRDSAKSALIQQALKDAKFFEVDANPNPDALATALNRPAFQQASKVFFRGEDKKELDGFIRMLDATRRAQSGQAVAKTGEQLLLPGGTAALGASVGAGILPAAPAVAAITVASGLAKAYESKAFRNLLIKLSNTKTGSKPESRLLERLTPFVALESQVARTEQEQTQ